MVRAFRDTLDARLVTVERALNARAEALDARAEELLGAPGVPDVAGVVKSIAEEFRALAEEPAGRETTQAC